jgi:hypothetical protein
VLVCVGAIGALLGIVAPGLPRWFGRQIVICGGKIKLVCSALSRRLLNRR